jgi:hypothetical protein
MTMELRTQGLATALWARDWRDRSAALLALLAAVDREAPESASALLAWVRHCRLTLPDPPDLKLRNLRSGTLDEVWEAARSILYGDLEPARLHTDAALRCVRDIDEFLQARRN